MVTVISGDFEWDDAEAEQNELKHGVGFDPTLVVLEDRGHDGRLGLIGFSLRARLLLVVHAEMDTRTRIISARKAIKYEERIHREA